MYKKVFAALAVATGVVAGLVFAMKMAEIPMEKDEDDSWDDLDEDWA